MANELRSRTNFVGGLVEDNPLTNVATTLNSAGLAALPVIDTTNHAALILDPDGIHGAPEIVHVTAHSASSTTATILRAQESTSARQHLRDTYWVHTATVRDFAHEGWQTYSPTWTTDGSPSSIGNGSLNGTYLWDQSKQFLHLSIELSWGSTTNGGTNGWHFGLPSGFSAVGSGWTAAGLAYDTSLIRTHSMTCNFAGTQSSILSADSSHEFVTSTIPFTWATGDYMKLSGGVRVTFS